MVDVGCRIRLEWIGMEQQSPSRRKQFIVDHAAAYFPWLIEAHVFFRIASKFQPGAFLTPLWMAANLFVRLSTLLWDEASYPITLSLLYFLFLLSIFSLGGLVILHNSRLVIPSKSASIGLRVLQNLFIYDRWQCMVLLICSLFTYGVVAALFYSIRNLELLMGSCIYFSLLVSVSLCITCLHFLQMIFYTPAYGCITISSAFLAIYCSLGLFFHVNARGDSSCSVRISVCIQAFQRKHQGAFLLPAHSPLSSLRYAWGDWHVFWNWNWCWTAPPPVHLLLSAAVPSIPSPTPLRFLSNQWHHA